MVHHFSSTIENVERGASRIVAGEYCSGEGGEEAIDDFGAGSTADGGVEGEFTELGFFHCGFGVGGEEGVDYYRWWLSAACLLEVFRTTYDVYVVVCCVGCIWKKLFYV